MAKPAAGSVRGLQHKLKRVMKVGVPKRIDLRAEGASCKLKSSLDRQQTPTGKVPEELKQQGPGKPFHMFPPYDDVHWPVIKSARGTP